MLNQQTLEKLIWMKLSTLGAEYRRQQDDLQMAQLSFDERFGLLVDSEFTARQNKHLGNLIAKAGMRQNACLEDLDYSVSRGLARDLVIQLSSCGWIREGHNLLIIGAAGTGKILSGLCFRQLCLPPEAQSPILPRQPPADRSGHCPRRWQLQQTDEESQKSPTADP